jgi:hypothetical protein
MSASHSALITLRPESDLICPRLLKHRREILDVDISDPFRHEQRNDIMREAVYPRLERGEDIGEGAGI